MQWLDLCQKHKLLPNFLRQKSVHFDTLIAESKEFECFNILRLSFPIFHGFVLERDTK